MRDLQHTLAAQSGFYSVAGGSDIEAHQRLAYLKDVIESKGGHRIFYRDGKPSQDILNWHVTY